MTKYIELNKDDFNSAVSIIQKTKDNGKLLIKLNAKTYGGLITLDGTSEEINSLCSILENNGIITEWNINFNSDRIEFRKCFF